jgi:hypothetical protein
MKQVFSVQVRPSSQSEFSQHCWHSPLQHRSDPSHFGDASHLPSALQRSVVQRFLSSQSSGPSQLTLVLAPAPSAPLPDAPLSVPPAPAFVESSLAVNGSPEQPLVQMAGSNVPTNAKSTTLGLKKLTEFSSIK